MLAHDSAEELRDGVEWVVLVDQHDKEIGKAEKLRAHIDGRMHRAFSVFIFNDLGELLLQKRASGKYHSGGLWTNTCCGHPRPGEALIKAGERRLYEEMGFESRLEKAFQFSYLAAFENGLTENEIDHVLLGTFNGTPRPNALEAEGFRWTRLAALSLDLAQKPGEFSAWLKKALPMLIEFFDSPNCPYPGAEALKSNQDI